MNTKTRVSRRDLILRAIRRNSETVERCLPRIDDKEPVTENEIKIANAMLETVAKAKGRIQAYEAVLSAMNGNNKWLKLDGSY